MNLLFTVIMSLLLLAPMTNSHIDKYSSGMFLPLSIWGSTKLGDTPMKVFLNTHGKLSNGQVTQAIDPSKYQYISIAQFTDKACTKMKFTESVLATGICYEDTRTDGTIGSVIFTIPRFEKNQTDLEIIESIYDGPGCSIVNILMRRHIYTEAGCQGGTLLELLNKVPLVPSSSGMVTYEFLNHEQCSAAIPGYIWYATGCWYGYNLNVGFFCRKGILSVVDFLYYKCKGPINFVANYTGTCRAVENRSSDPVDTSISLDLHYTMACTGVEELPVLSDDFTVDDAFSTDTASIRDDLQKLQGSTRELFYLRNLPTNSHPAKFSANFLWVLIGATALVTMAFIAIFYRTKAVFTTAFCRQ